MDDTTVILEADADDLLGDLSKVGLAAEETASILGDLSDVELVPDGFLGDLSDIGLVSIEAEETIDLFKLLEDQAEETAEEMSGVGEGFDLSLVEQSLVAITELLQEQIDATNSVTEAIEEEDKAVAVVANDFTDYSDAVEESTTSTEEFADETEQSRGILARMGDTAKSVAGFLAGMFVIDITRIPKLLEKIGKKLFGGSEEWDQLQASLDGMLHTIGNALAPILDAVVHGFEAVRETIVRLTPTISRIAGVFAKFANGVINSVVELVVPAIELLGEIALDIAASITASWQILGEMVTVLWESIVIAFGGLAESFNTAGEAGLSFRDVLSGAWDSVQEITLFAFSFIQTVIENWEMVCSRAVMRFALDSITAFESIKYFFSEVLPASVTWFSDQFIATLGDIGTYLGAVLENWKENFGNFFGAVWSWLTGDGFDFRFTALEEGFERTLIALPEIADRHKGAIEESLAAAIEATGQSFEARFGENIAANQAAFDHAKEQIDAMDVDNGLTFPPEIEIKDPEKSGESDDKDTDSGELKTNKDLDKDDKEETGTKGATGLAELAIGIQDALFNRADPVADAVKDGTQKSVKAMEAVAEGTKDVRKAVESLDTRARYA